MRNLSYRWIKSLFFPSYPLELILDANTPLSQEALLPFQTGNRPANPSSAQPLYARRASHQNLRLAPRFR